LARLARFLSLDIMGEWSSAAGSHIVIADGRDITRASRKRDKQIRPTGSVPDENGNFNRPAMS
jgi:hypothetical protein